MGAATSGLDVAALAKQLGRQAFPASKVHVRVDKDEASNLGLEINLLLRSRLLQISEVKAGGLAHRWNEEHCREERIRRGDWLLSVNDVSDPPSAVLAQMQRPGPMHIVISRHKPSSFSSRGAAVGSAHAVPLSEARRIPVAVTTSADGCRLGIDVATTSKAITVVGIKEGAISKWNQANPSDEVRIGDRIVFVDGAPRHELLAALERCGDKRLVVWRGPQDSCGEQLDERSFDQLPDEIVDVDVDVSGAEVCGICLEDWAPGESAVRLPCGHHFHRDCCRQWLTGRSALCPLCQWAADCPRMRSAAATTLADTEPCCGNDGTCAEPRKESDLNDDVHSRSRRVQL